MNLRQLAKGRHCHFRHPGCSPGPENEKVVLCHAPSVDKALARKSPDWWGAPGCQHCHDVMDGRAGPTLMPKEVHASWNRAIYEWQSQLVEEGLLVVQSGNDSRTEQARDRTGHAAAP